MSRRLRRTKIVTTLGPATDRDNNLEKIVATGADIMRTNFSHDSPEGHEIRVDKVRETAVKLGCHVAILDDLRGPKIRVSTFKKSKALLNTGNKFLLNASLGKGEDDKEKVGVDYKGLLADTAPGDILLLDDSRVQLKVLEVQDMKVFTEATASGPLSNNKGTGKLGDSLSAEALTEKDKVDIKTAALIGAGYLTAPLPRYGENLNYARRLARGAGCDAKIVVKVERTEAVCSQEAMDDVILVSDVVMAACGDLGVEIGDSELASIQKALVRHARQLNRAIITATQMIESMITNPVSTRAEVMDVTNVVLDSTDTAILLAETAAGQYPSETVVAVARICLGAEKILNINISKHRLDAQSDNAEGIIAVSAMYVANHLKGITTIITMTESGYTALMTSRINSGLPISAVPRRECVLNLTVLYHSIASVRFDSVNDDVVATSEAVNLLRDKSYLMSGDLVIVTQGNVISTVGSTSTTRILTVE